MWILVMYDFPTSSKKQRSEVRKFRTNLIQNGFKMFQYSIYVKYCFNYENVDTHKKRIRKLLTKNGKISIIQFTDKQFSEVEMFNGNKHKYEVPKLVIFI